MVRECIDLGEYLTNDSRFFQKVVGDSCSDNLSSVLLNEQGDIFTETTGVVVSHGLCVSESFQDWVTSQNLLR